MLEGEWVDYRELGLRVEGSAGEGNGRSRSVGEGKGLTWKRTTGERPQWRAVGTWVLGGQRPLKLAELGLLPPPRAWRSLSSNRRSPAASRPPN